MCNISIYGGLTTLPAALTCNRCRFTSLCPQCTHRQPMKIIFVELLNYLIYRNSIQYRTHEKLLTSKSLRGSSICLMNSVSTNVGT